MPTRREDDGSGDGDPGGSGRPGPEPEAYALQALEWARRTYLLEGTAPTIQAAASATGASEHLLRHRFRTDFELLAEALSPHGRPPDGGHARHADEEPQQSSLDRRDADLEQVRARLAAFYAETANPEPGAPPPIPTITSFTPDAEAAVREGHKRASHPRPRQDGR